MKVDKDTESKIRAVLAVKEGDWISVVEEIGENPKKFFENRDLSNKDFSMSDMSSCSFSGSDISESVFEKGGVSIEQLASSRFCENVRFVTSDSKSDVTRENFLSRFLESIDEQSLKFNPTLLADFKSTLADAKRIPDEEHFISLGATFERKIRLYDVNYKVYQFMDYDGLNTNTIKAIRKSLHLVFQKMMIGVRRNQEDLESIYRDEDVFAYSNTLLYKLSSLSSVSRDDKLEAENAVAQILTKLKKIVSHKLEKVIQLEIQLEALSEDISSISSCFSIARYTDCYPILNRTTSKYSIHMPML